jgi:hypothetical protein
MAVAQLPPPNTAIDILGTLVLMSFRDFNKGIFKN